MQMSLSGQQRYMDGLHVAIAMFLPLDTLSLDRNKQQRDDRAASRPYFIAYIA